MTSTEPQSLNFEAASHPLILTKGNDLLLVVKYKPLVVDDDGNPVLDSNGRPQFAIADYPDDATVQLEIDTETPIITPADIDGPAARMLVDYLLLNPLGSGILYRVKIIHADGYDQVIVKGKTKRKDS